MDTLFSPSGLRFIAFSAVAIPLAIRDAKTMRVPRLPLLALIAFLIATSGLSSLEAIANSVAGCLVGFFSYYMTRLLTMGGIGLADVWMATCVGALGGSRFLARASLIAIALTAFSSRAGRGERSIAAIDRRRPVPFIPTLVAGVYGSAILAPLFGHSALFP